MLFFVLFCWKYRWWFLSFSFVIVVMYSISCVISNCYHLLYLSRLFCVHCVHCLYIASTGAWALWALRLTVLYCTELILLYWLLSIPADLWLHCYWYFWFWFNHCWYWHSFLLLLLFIIIITTTLGDRTHGLVVVLVSCCALSTLGDILSIVVWSVRSLLLL